MKKLGQSIPIESIRMFDELRVYQRLETQFIYQLLRLYSIILKLFKIMQESPLKKIHAFLTKASQNNVFQKALQQGAERYQLNPFNIMKLTPQKIFDIYEQIYSKFYNSQAEPANDSWYENQLRIFIWMIVVYAHLQEKTLLELREEDWEMFSCIFIGKQANTFQFQSLCITKNRKSRKWTEQETEMLIETINQKQDKNRWNEIAKKIFINSHKHYFRTPKQCREQWINHLDPTKLKSKWTSIEDYQMIKGILQHGKKWSKVAKYLGGRRTEHMVKNRYKSMIRNQMKRRDYEDQEEILLSKIKQRLQSSLLIKNYNRNKRTEQLKTQEVPHRNLNKINSQIQIQLPILDQKKINPDLPSNKPLPHSLSQEEDQQPLQADLHYTPVKQQDDIQHHREPQCWQWNEEPLIEQISLHRIPPEPKHEFNFNQLDFFFYEPCRSQL